MNLLTKKLFNYLGLAVLSALFIFSCQQSEESLFIGDPDFNDTVKTESINLSITQYWADSVRSSLRYNYQTGQFIDLEGIGKMTAKAYFQPQYPIKLVDSLINSSSSLDSLTINFLRSDILGVEDAGFQQRLTLHQLNDTLENRDYYTFQSASYNSEILASGYQPGKKDGAVDTLYMKVDESFAEDFILALKTQDFQDQRDFNNFFKGLALISDENSKFIYSYQYNSYMTLHFSSEVPGLETKEFKINFFFNSSTQDVNGNTGNYNTNFTNLDHDFTGSPLDGLTRGGEIKPRGGYFVGQNGTGLVPRINYQNVIERLKEIKGGFIVNNISLILNTERLARGMTSPESCYMPYANSRNRVVQIDSVIQSIQTPSPSIPIGGSSSPYTIMYDKSLQDYSPLNLTAYSQAVVDNADFINRTERIPAEFFIQPQFPTVGNFNQESNNLNFFQGNEQNTSVEVYYVEVLEDSE
ncbi:DUF4270 family protein [Aureibacter tunicatorum]|uniref:DUF4270 domain-containing protein n=1 Tax=Aureibacter tunicatorum TaxID=866807 RepID=A0AAE3XJ46_9BACT|nr:DUF4270 family protein [Aureibacter tunicatorum]MDR6237337.1 hypothetical protein [Aureibacter tunicatorum]BDD06328.1 hypothetical protein AUTU_38110 [Aureibacter tunicatorum]